VKKTNRARNTLGADSVTQSTGGQRQSCKRERVGVDHPLLPTHATTQGTEAVLLMVQSELLMVQSETSILPLQSAGRPPCDR
jgi:hypothetical protein